MASFAPSYQQDGNDVWLNQILGEIVNVGSTAGCRTAGRDYEDDMVDASCDEEGNSQSGLQKRVSQRSSRILKSPLSFASTSRAGSRQETRRDARRESKRLSQLSLQAEELPEEDPEPALGPAREPEPVPLPEASPDPQPVPQRARSQQKRVQSGPNDTHFIVTSPRPSTSPGNYVTIPSPRTLRYSETSTLDEQASDVWSPQLPRPVATRLWSSTTRAESTRDCASLPNLEKRKSMESMFSGFAPHPAVRPFHDREALGEAAGNTEDDPSAYPKPLPLFLIILGVCLSVFIISLDRNIITTAIPQITAQFHSYEDIGWYGSAYLLTASAFQPLYGRIYMSFNTKNIFLSSLAIFEVGSIVCGTAPTSTALIVGRAVQGLGSAGILTGAFVIGTHAVPLQKRPVLFAVVGMLFACGALCGPLLGGVFTDLVTWRWCFYVNLPVGGITLLTIMLFFHPKRVNRHSQRPSWLQRILALDLVGNAILLAASVMLFLALELSEERNSFSSVQVIGLLTGFGIATVLFIGWMWYKGDDALLPPRIIGQRTVLASCLAAFCIYATMVMHSYYLPIWFQAVKGSNAIESGRNMLPYTLANALFGLMAGIFVSKNGLFAPPAIVGCAIGTVGACLFATFQVNTNSATWIGFEVLTSTGLGLAVQQGFSAVQTALPLHEVPIGTAAVVASQSFGGAVFVSIGNTLLQSYLLDANKTGAVPGVNVRLVIMQGATAFRQFVPPDKLGPLLVLYNLALRRVFIAAGVMSGLAFLCSLGMEWRSVKTPQKNRRDSDAGDSLAAKSEKAAT